MLSKSKWVSKLCGGWIGTKKAMCWAPAEAWGMEQAEVCKLCTSKNALKALKKGA